MMLPQNWAKQEMNSIDMGDSRINARTANIIDNFYKSIGSSIPQSMTSRSEVQACYRFLENDLVSPEGILEPHLQSTMERAKDHPVVLLPSDTSSIDYTGKNSIKDLGILEGKHSQGLLLHATIAITPGRICLGVTDAQMWARDPDAENRKQSSHERMNTPIEEKESFRWLINYRNACELAKKTPQTQFVSIFDREGDIIDVIAEATATGLNEPKADLIVRANHDRRLDNGSDNDNLKSELRTAPVLGEFEFDMPGDSRTGREARRVKQTIRAKEVIFSVRRGKNNSISGVKLNAILAVEENPPEGKTPVTWFLLTTLPIDTAESALKVLEYYLCRWEIEVFFKVLKSGCKVEERSLRTADRLKNLIAIFCVVSWRVLYAMKLGRECPDLPADIIFDAAEWKAVWKVVNKGKSLPQTPPPLGEVMLLVARLGGVSEPSKRSSSWTDRNMEGYDAAV